MFKTVAELSDFLRNSAAGRALLAERARETRARRLELIAELRRIEHEDQRVQARIAKDLAPAAAKLAGIEAQYVEAAAAVARLKTERRNYGTACEHATKSVRGQLEELADPRIDEASRRLERRFDAHCRQSADGHRRGGGEFRTDEEQQQLMTAIISARAAFDALRYADVPDIDAAIATIEASIPWSMSAAASAA